eukprot:TRINITY_DN87692_c0_g1_i2.p1 TRINITY_DN87692_c0_g1~~TRINITY_DN87692_c0_g1_i2.p1  ORF type:complete len:1283 (-),score=196.88 TRINITY_DN87692_c0_g1_i2:130-3978(-)
MELRKHQLPSPKHQHIPFLPTIGSPSRGSGKLNKSIARWRTGDEGSIVFRRGEDADFGPGTPTGRGSIQESVATTLAQQLREANGTSSLPVLPRLSPRTMPRQSSNPSLLLGGVTHVEQWRGAGAVLLRHKETELPMLVPPQAHRVLGLGQEGTHAAALAKQHKIAHSGYPQPSKSRRVPAMPGLARGQFVSKEDRKLTCQQASLAADREFVAEVIAEEIRARNPQVAQKRQDELMAEHLWSVIFAPLPNPRGLLPPIFALQPGIVSADGINPVKLQTCARGKLNDDEILDVIRLCSLFSRMTQPPPLPKTHVEPASSKQASRQSSGASWRSGNALVLSRPSFCHMLCALEGLSLPPDPLLILQGIYSMKTAPKSRMRFHWAVKCFDAIASPCPVKGAYSPSGNIVGIKLPPLPKQQDNEQVDSMDFVNDRQAIILSKLFLEFVSDMANDPVWMGQAEDESFPRARKHFFENQLPAAEAHAVARLRLLQRRAAALRKPSPEEIAEAARLEAEAQAQPQRELEEAAKKTKRRSFGKRSMSESTLGTSPSHSQVSSPKASPTNVTRKLSRSQTTSPESSPTHATKRHHRSLTSTSALRKVLEEEQEEKKKEDESPKEEPLSARPLPAEVVKVELVTSQLLEPEIAQFVAMFQGIFRVLHQQYCDIPTRNGGGHMSIIAFGRFCFDFGLYPLAIDLQTVQRLYHVCSKPETELAVQAPVSDPSPIRKVIIDSSPSSPSSPSNPSSTRSRSSKGSVLKSSTLNQSQKLTEVENMIHWEGLQIPERLSWLTKPVSSLNETESTCFFVLWAMNDWMKDRLLKPSDVFFFLDSDGNGEVDCNELQTGVQFMCLESGPTSKDVEDFFPLLASPATEAIPFWDLQQALLVIMKQKAKLDAVANFFLKAHSEMNPAERKITIFLTDVAKLMEMKRWTPDELFQAFGLSGTAAVRSEMLVERAQLLLRYDVGRCGALEVETPFELIDPLGAGVIEEEEFLTLVRQFVKARSFQGDDAQGRQRRQLQAATSVLAESQQQKVFMQAPASPAGPGPRRKRPSQVPPKPVVNLFGLRNFIECLLLLAFEVLGFRGSSTQAEQPAYIKAIWLLLFLRWQFDEKQVQENTMQEQEKAYLEGVRRQQLKKGEELFTHDLTKCHYLQPLKQLFRTPELFESVTPHAEAATSEENATSSACLKCGQLPYMGWGNMLCPFCSLADNVLEACLKEKQEQAPCKSSMNTEKKRSQAQEDGCNTSRDKQEEAKRPDFISMVLQRSDPSSSKTTLTRRGSPIAMLLT